MVHPLVARQIARLGLDAVRAPDPAGWAQFLERISKAYSEHDEDRYLQERALGLTSKEMRELQQSLERENRHLLSIVETAPIAMAMFDRQMRYLAHSERWLADYGLVGQRILGRTHYEVFPDIPERWKELHRRCLSGEVLSNPEDRFDRADGSSLYLRWTIRPWLAPDGAIGGIMMVTDSVDDLVKAREAALVASRQKAQFLANMSHEIRTPLSGVIGMTELLLATNLEPESREYAETIRGSAEHLLALLNDVLDYSKIEAGRLDLEEIVFEPRRVVLEAVDLHADRAQRKRLAIGCRVDPAVPLALRGDPGRLRQVLLNLVGNAVKFTEQGGITIEVSALRCTSTDATLRFAVQDSGIGIEPAHREHLFQVFSQADGTTTRKYGGTGLGLAISKQIVERMQGRIGLESTAGAGSTFWFEAPFRLGAAPAADDEAPCRELAPEPPPVAADRAEPRVLLVEDHPVNQKIAQRTLEKLGCRVELAVDGAQAVAALAGERYDLVLMDCQMPLLDGFEATRRVRSRESESGAPRVPIVAMTANALPGDRERCLDAGMDDYVAKPVQRAALERLLERWARLPA